MYMFTVLRALPWIPDKTVDIFWHIFDKFDDQRDIGGKAIDLLCRFSFSSPFVK